MNPIEFQVEKTVNNWPNDVSEMILDVANWSNFDGYGLLPGIDKAEFEKRTDELIGSRISVANSDGTGHFEEILEWEPGKKIVMKLHEFPTTLSYIATHFIEEWNFQEVGRNETLITRNFKLYPTSFLTRPLLNQISVMMKRGIEKHLDSIAEEFEKD